MPAYAPPIDEFMFVVHDVLRVHERADLPGFDELTPDLTRPIFEGAGLFLQEVWQPLNQVGDEEGCRLENGLVRTPSGFREAYRGFCEADWNKLGAPQKFGGAGLPSVIALPVSEMCSSANAALAHYTGLTYGAHSTLALTGAPWMLEHVVPRMVSGEWCGTMCLTEPHCGTDLKLMKTRAVAQPDGTFRITGTKIFISGGDHDLSENIIHLVLAKTANEAGQYVNDLATVNLFMVPKILVDPETGQTGVRNGVKVGGIEKKMGTKGSATCVLNFDDAVGYRLASIGSGSGKPSSSAGMSGMFHMMNHARLGTGTSALAAAEVAYQNSALYARERRSGQAASPANRSGEPADPIIVHPDVRRLLLQQRAFVEGARTAALWVALLLDEANVASDPAQRERAQGLAHLLTPVIKAYFTDQGFAATNAAVQVFGGHGYIRDNGMEQFVRDARIYQLYEGANGIQAVDLVARKLPSGGGRDVAAFLREVESIAATAEGRSSEIASYAKILRGACNTAQEILAWLSETARAQADTVGAASYDVLTLFGALLLGAMWLRTAVVAVQQIEASQGNPILLRRKLILARYWFEREMPAIDALQRRATAGPAGLMALPADFF